MKLYGKVRNGSTTTFYAMQNSQILSKEGSHCKVQEYLKKIFFSTAEDTQELEMDTTVHI